MYFILELAEEKELILQEQGKLRRGREIMRLNVGLRIFSIGLEIALENR